ncbi:hypothetical protein EDB92DRAFT_1858280 [Lactarius akahatsu]|uniref:Secreted protein n=1 Tax=Lactarius akahatsu TaxID=416441 RepID=A0AAD4LHN9_9AGAM|nr:hypothetical protein EDB92DRAFT_1858280 [Lactarius akahatsu]
MFFFCFILFLTEPMSRCCGSWFFKISPSRSSHPGQHLQEVPPTLHPSSSSPHCHHLTHTQVHGRHLRPWPFGASPSLSPRTCRDAPCKKCPSLLHSSASTSLHTNS